MTDPARNSLADHRLKKSLALLHSPPAASTELRGRCSTYRFLFRYHPTSHARLQTSQLLCISRDTGSVLS